MFKEITELKQSGLKLQIEYRHLILFPSKNQIVPQNPY